MARTDTARAHEGARRGPSRLVRRDDDRIVAGVASGLAASLGVPSVVVRVIFVLLALAGGVGVVVYLVAWVVMPREATPSDGPELSRPDPEWLRIVALGAILLGALLLLRAVGLPFSDLVVWPLALAGAGAVLIWSRARGDAASHARSVEEHEWLRRLPPAARDAAVALLGTGRGAWLRVVAGSVFVVAGITAFLAAADAFDALWKGLLAFGAITLGAALVLGPWLWRLATELAQERRERIRSEERADMAAHLHDSVLQTLSMVQRQADDPKEVRRLARRQERDLRAWLSGASVSRDARHLPPSFGAALDALAADVEHDEGVAVDVVRVGDHALAEPVNAMLAAATEAIRNAARHSSAATISVFAEVSAGEIAVYVRDRGVGFDIAEVPADRRGVRESIEGRMHRAGGTAVVRTAPGEGTEIELRLPMVSPPVPATGAASDSASDAAADEDRV